MDLYSKRGDLLTVILLVTISIIFVGMTNEGSITGSAIGVSDITPTDGIGAGVAKNSTSLTIRNYVPASPTLLNPANGYSSGLLPEFNWTISEDYDGDTVYYIIQMDNNSDFSSVFT